MDPVAPRRRPGGRSTRVRQAVLAATREELVEHGYGGLRHSGIADRAGVHRSTVHRRWPDLEDLVTDALVDVADEQVPIPDTGSVRSDLLALLGAVAAFVDTPTNRSVVRALVGESARSPGIAAVVGRAWSARFRAGEEVIARAVARGELRAHLEPSVLLAMFTGPLYQRLLLTDEPLDRRYVATIVELGLAGTLAERSPEHR